MVASIDWTPAVIGKLRSLWGEGLSTAAIGVRMGISKNAVVGKAHRLNLPARPSPIRNRSDRPTRERVSRISHSAHYLCAATAIGQDLQPQLQDHSSKMAPSSTRPPVLPPRERFSMTGETCRAPRNGEMCCWPIGEPGRPGFGFCGDQAIRGRPYCDEHCGDRLRHQDRSTSCSDGGCRCPGLTFIATTASWWPSPGVRTALASLLTLLDAGVSPDRIDCYHHDVDGDGPGFMDWPCTTSYCRAVTDALGVPLYLSWREGGFLREMLRDGVPTAPIRFQTPDGLVCQVGGTGQPGTRLRFPQVTANLNQRWCSAYLKDRLHVGADPSAGPISRSSNADPDGRTRRREHSSRALRNLRARPNRHPQRHP